jgi:hypothetical protein
MIKHFYSAIIANPHGLREGGDRLSRFPLFDFQKKTEYSD